VQRGLLLPSPSAHTHASYAIGLELQQSGSTITSKYGLPEADYANACEMKRLFVRPGFRRFGLGRLLAQALLDEARGAGYSAMLLDTLDDMEAARELYATLGFEEIPPYYFNPIPGAHYLKADLT